MAPDRSRAGGDSTNVAQIHKGDAVRMHADKPNGPPPSPDYSALCEGDMDPTMRKRIHTLIVASSDYIVYLDDDLFVEWAFDPGNIEAVEQDFGDVANEVGHLETLSMVLLTSRYMEPFRRLLGEALARIIAENNPAGARAILAKAAAFLQSRSQEQARLWYLKGSGIACALAIAAASVILWFRSDVDARLGADAATIAIGTCLGGLGAMLSILTRTSTIPVDAAAGAKLHYIESAARVLVGMCGALVVSMAVKANIVLGLANGTAPEGAVLLVLSLAAGASERILPGVIKKVEGMVNSAE
jgi:hypothetical protein